jgi:hypothetical protein
MAKGKQESGKGGKAQTDNSKAAGKKGGKGAGGGEGDAKSTSKVKGAQSINVRHILVSFQITLRDSCRCCAMEMMISSKTGSVDSPIQIQPV